MELSERVSRYMACLEPAVSGQCGHLTTFRAACILVWGLDLSVQESVPFMEEFNARCSPPWSDKELNRKLEKAARRTDHEKPRGWLLSKWDLEEESGQLSQSPDVTTCLTTPEPAWPSPNLPEIDAIVRKGFGLYDLWEASPHRFDEVEQREVCETVVRSMFPPGKSGQPLLCCGKTPFEAVTQPLSGWLGTLHEQSFIVPNRMIALAGINEDGDISARCLDNTSQRERLVIECDFSKFARDGQTPTIWKPLIDGWEAEGISVADAGASILWELTHLSDLALAVHSAGKSVHGWFDSTRRDFMHTAVRLGADRATWTRCQFVRMPEGTRQNGKIQQVYFFGGEK